MVSSLWWWSKIGRKEMAIRESIVDSGLGIPKSDRARVFWTPNIKIDCCFDDLLPFTTPYLVPIEFKKDPELHKDLVDMATQALDVYNLTKDRKGVSYKFKKIKRATEFCSQSWIVRVTFRARGANGITRTFRAKISQTPSKWKTRVLFIRIRPYWRSREKGERKTPSPC